MTFKLSIELGNDAMQTAEDVASALAALSGHRSPGSSAPGIVCDRRDIHSEALDYAR
jgi:hypothetical protein